MQRWVGCDEDRPGLDGEARGGRGEAMGNVESLHEIASASSCIDITEK